MTPPFFFFAHICKAKERFSYDRNPPLSWVKGLLSQPRTTTPLGEKMPLVLRTWTFVAIVPLLGNF